MNLAKACSFFLRGMPPAVASCPWRRASSAVCPGRLDFRLRGNDGGENGNDRGGKWK